MKAGIKNASNRNYWSLTMKLTDIVQRNDTSLGRTFDAIVIFLIIYLILTLCVSTLPDLSESAKFYLKISDYIVFTLFTVEYVLRIATAPNKRKYIFSFFGMLDLIALLPFYLSLGIGLEATRIFRLFAFIQILRLSKYSNATRRFHLALVNAKEELVLVLVIAAMLLFLSSAGIYFFEHEAQPEAFKSVFHSMWWSIATLSGVGYGDVVPVTAGGRFFTGVVMVCSLAVVAVPAGIMASALSRVSSEEHNSRN